jgi:hypothetical protein
MSRLLCCTCVDHPNRLLSAIVRIPSPLAGLLVVCVTTHQDAQICKGRIPVDSWRQVAAGLESRWSLHRFDFPGFSIFACTLPFLREERHPNPDGQIPLGRSNIPTLAYRLDSSKHAHVAR